MHYKDTSKKQPRTHVMYSVSTQTPLGTYQRVGPNQYNWQAGHDCSTAYNLEDLYNEMLHAKAMKYM